MCELVHFLVNIGLLDVPLHLGVDGRDCLRWSVDEVECREVVLLAVGVVPCQGEIRGIYLLLNLLLCLLPCSFLGDSFQGKKEGESVLLGKFEPPGGNEP